MRTGRGRLVLLVFLLIVGSGAAAYTALLAQLVDDLGRAGQAMNARVDQLLLTVQKIDHAQQAYVVPNGVDRLTAEQLPALSADLLAGVGEMERHVRSPRSIELLQALRESGRALEQFEARAEEHVRLGHDLMAADVISVEAHNALAAIGGSLRGIRTAETAAIDAGRTTALRQAWVVIAAAAAVWLLGLLALARIPRTPPATQTRVETPSAILALSEPKDRTPATPVISVNLPGAADVCTAIGRMTDARDLPPLLTRTAAVLDASGVVVWMAAGDELFAASAHGYDARALRRIGPIHRAAINATAAAWRTGSMQVVSGDDVSRGAIVAPMWGPDRCVGVLAVEVSSGRETDVTTQAVTRFLAAQLAATLAPWPAASVADAQTPPLENAAEA